MSAALGLLAAATAGVFPVQGVARQSDPLGPSQPETPIVAPVAPAPEPGITRLPEAAKCLEAFRAVDGWVRAWRAPDDAAMIDPENTAGVCVTLRLSGAAGRTLARASVWADDESRGQTLWRATRAALAEAEPKLKLPEDATREAQRLAIAERVQIDVQFAGTPVPIAADTLDAAAAQLNPGRDGVLARVRGAGDDSKDAFSAVFPASMLSMGLTPGRGLSVALGQLKLPPVALSELREKSGVEVYRFEARHAAQVKPGEPPELLYRGGALVPMQAVSSQGLRDFAAAMADHISTHLWRGPGAYGLRGNYNPLTDTYNPAVATPREQAVAALALLRFARTPGIVGDSAARARETAFAVLASFPDRAEGEEDPLAPVSAAAWLLASTEAAMCGMQPPMDAAAAEVERKRVAFREAALKALRAQVKLEPGADPALDRVTWTPAQGAPPISPGEKALLAHALVRVSGEDEAARRLARACVRDLFRSTEPGALVGLMPWLAWAELELLTDPNAPVPSAEALRQLRTLCWSRQVSAAQAGENPDLVGGIVFAGAGGGAVSEDPATWPTWQTLRPLSVMGTLLADKRLTTDDELQREVLSLLTSLRFVRQLGADEPVTHMFRDPSRALGGVRPAVWENTVFLDATSMALLTVSEALRGAEARTEPRP
ncbi:MAG: hypothetical protein ACKVZJ_13635 [Phycisphaerales bacterium]